MMNEFLSVLLGAVHAFILPEYVPLVDAIFTPIFVLVILIFTCMLVLRVFSAVYRASFGKE